MSTSAALGVSVALVALSAFFVAIEFALVAARRHRLEDAAHRSASARAALRSAQDLSLLLAGSQLGITLCTLGLGAIGKPAVDALLSPLLGGLGETAGAVVSFVLSLVIVTFVHLVVGEMAPKSWAIAHPERSATLLALPMRGFMVVTGPLLRGLNGLANRCLRAAGVDPVDEVDAGRSPDDLRELVEHSARVGALDEASRARLVTVLELETTPLRAIVRPVAAAATVAPDADPAAIRAAARTSGHLRLLVGDGSSVVHVRDALTDTPGLTAADLARPVPTLDAGTTLRTAVSALRQGRPLALVAEHGRPIGLVTLADVLDRVLPVARP